MLIEKEWLSFGFPFGNRLGHGLGNKKSDTELFAPSFLMFMDAGKNFLGIF